MGARAAEDALRDAGLASAEVDLILNASGTQQQPIPDGAALVQAELGLGETGVTAFSVHGTCLSFVAALDVAATYVASGRYARVLIVTSEIGSVGLNPREPESATLIGDGAAAVIVGRAGDSEGSRVEALRFETYAHGAAHTEIRGGGTFLPPGHPASSAEDFTFHMDGPKVLRLARAYAPGFLERLRPGLSSSLAGVDVVVPHQASLVGLRLLSRFGWPDEAVVSTLAELGNCVAASIPLTLHHAVRTGRLRRGQRVLLVGTGAGFSIGGAVLTY